ncbi:MAG: hypothetical protein R3305_03710 [Gammaproteobacteria bacterium]|nr:hypothetical protein [Gammaproteobacteria bacterium]
MASQIRNLAGLAAGLAVLTGCSTTARLEPFKQTNAVLEEGEGVVVLARRHHTTHEAEQDFVDCIADSLASGKQEIIVHDSTEFEDKLYPWFEPSTAPLNTTDLSELLDKPGVMQAVNESGVRFLVWLDGSTDRVASGGSITCAASVGGAGCMGLAWWENDARYDVTVWDVEALETSGTIHADVRGRSVMPAVIIPFPFISRPRAKACRDLTDQLEQFLTTPTGYGAGPEELG